jgi:apolipoprotein N-acyltransferase
VVWTEAATLVQPADEAAFVGRLSALARDHAVGIAAGAICYDYDFPALALAHARLGVALVALPSSDWAGIDPMHTQMAAVRAIEGGFSLLRSTRMGLSAGIDAHGRLRGWLSSNESDDRVLVVTLPAQRVPTLYSTLGDWAVLPFAGVLVTALLSLRRGRWLQGRHVAKQSAPFAPAPAPNASLKSRRFLNIRSAPIR